LRTVSTCNRSPAAIAAFVAPSAAANTIRARITVLIGTVGRVNACNAEPSSSDNTT
jgi:hypothetical protein